MRPPFVTWLLLVATPALALEGAEPFTADQVRADAIRYVKQLFASAPPTLEFYSEFHGMAEDEADAELAECERRWGCPYAQVVDGKRGLDSKCLEFLKHRIANRRRVPSLYLQALRGVIKPDGQAITIDGVRVLDPVARNSPFLVVGRIGSTRVDLYHAANPTVADIGGLISISKINGKEVRELLKNNLFVSSKLCAP